MVVVAVPTTFGSVFPAVPPALIVIVSVTSLGVRRRSRQS
jgi:hypothetical protein